MFIPLHDDNPTRRTPVVTFLVIGLNVLVQLWSSHLNPVEQQLFAYRYGFVPARIMQLSHKEPVYAPLRVEKLHLFWGPYVEEHLVRLDPQPRQICLSLITCMFLHGGWLHLIGNMWFLWLFGNNVEDRLGPVRYLVLYLGGGLIAGLSHWAVTPQSLVPVIGASGAVAAVLGAYAITWPWARVSVLMVLVIFLTVIDVPALFVLGIWFIAQVLAGQESLREASLGGVAWWAHVGGFLAGVAVMPLLKATTPSENRYRY